MLWRSPKLRVTAVIPASHYLRTGRHTSQNKTACGKAVMHRNHHQPTTQCSVPQGIKSLRDPSILTGFSCPGGREETIPVTRTTDSTGALDNSFLTWECACKKKPRPLRNSKNRTTAPCSEASFVNGLFESGTTAYNPEETALMLLMQHHRRALITLKSACVSEPSVSPKTSFCPQHLLDTGYQRRKSLRLILR